MKKLLSVFLIMFIVSSGIAYGGNSNENAIGISELAGRSYIVLPFWIVGFIPMAFPTIFCFDESGDFLFVPLTFADNYSGYYTQTGSTFAAHCEFADSPIPELDLPHEVDVEGTSIGNIFIYGSITGQGELPNGTVIPVNGVFFGFSLPF